MADKRDERSEGPVEAPVGRLKRRGRKAEPAPELPPAKGTAARARTARSPVGRAPVMRPVEVDADGGDKQKLRARLSARMLKVPFFRRRYAKRVIKYLDKSKEKGRALPPEFAELQRFLGQVPKAQRAERFEEALSVQQSEEPISRDLRRAAANQQRRSGKNPAGYRPGSPPRSLQPRPKRPR